MLVASIACGASATLMGVMLGQGVFNRVLHRAPDPAHTASSEPEASDDGGESSDDASASAAIEPTVRPPLVPVRVTRVEIASCGDGDELDTAGERCDASPEVERILREALAKLGDCPAALVAGQSPTQVLSLGLRVDFARRIVVPVQGRASSVRDPLTFVACARQRGGMGPLDALFDQTHGKARYQYVVAMRFGPLDANAQRALDAGAAAEPSPAQPSTPAPAAITQDSGVAPAPPRLDAGGDDPTLSQPATVFMGTPLAHPEPAQVTWSRALIRAEPRNGAVITRLSFETRLTIEARSGSWYRVRWPSGTGWVFGEAIGRGGDAGVATP